MKRKIVTIVLILISWVFVVNAQTFSLSKFDNDREQLVHKLEMSDSVSCFLAIVIEETKLRQVKLYEDRYDSNNWYYSWILFSISNTICFLRDDMGISFPFFIHINPPSVLSIRLTEFRFTR